MTTNRDIADFRARQRTWWERCGKRPSQVSMRGLMHEPSWIRPAPPDYAWRIFTIVGIVLLSWAIAFGVWQHVTRAEPTWAEQVVRECEAQGKIAHVERAQDGSVLGVRCDIH